MKNFGSHWIADPRLACSSVLQSSRQSLGPASTNACQCSLLFLLCPTIIRQSSLDLPLHYNTIRQGYQALRKLFLGPRVALTSILSLPYRLIADHDPYWGVLGSIPVL